jgi:hypothetical protein
MNGVALLLAAASMAVDYSWDKPAGGQVEYMVRIEAEVVPSLVAGEEIHSDVPAEAGTVERFRLRVGVDGNQPVFTPAAPGRFGVAPDRSAVLVKAGAPAVETQAVSFGWQPNTEGKLQYYVQIDPSLLRTLEVGDEIQAAVDTTAGPAATFVVFGGNKQLPRIPTGDSGASANSGAVAPSRFSPDGETSPASGQLGNSRFGGSDNSTATATDPPAGSRFGSGSTGNNAAPGSTTAGTPGAGSSPRFGGSSKTDPSPPPPSAPRFGAGSNTTPPPSSRNTTPTYDGSANAFNPPALDTQTPPRENYQSANTGRDPAAFNQPSSRGGSDLYPANPSNNSYRNPPTQDPPPRTYDNRPTLDPPASNFGNRQPPANNPGAALNPPNNGAQPPPAAATGNNPQMAMVDPNTTRAAGTGLAAGPTAATGATTTEAAKPWWWGWLVFFFCLMCLSIGGNLYLGWTAVEFYQRYQRAVERLRAGTTTARA